MFFVFFFTLSRKRKKKKKTKTKTKHKTQKKKTKKQKTKRKKKMEGELIAVAFLIFLTPIIIAFALGSLLASELANVFSAGVLLSIAFFHVLAESYSQFEKALPGEDVIDKLRLLNGAFVLGWIFMLWIEKIFFGDQVFFLYSFFLFFCFLFFFFF